MARHDTAEFSELLRAEAERRSFGTWGYCHLDSAGWLRCRRDPTVSGQGCFGAAERDVDVTPEGIDPGRIPAGGMRPGIDGVDQVGGHGSLTDQLRGF